MSKLSTALKAEVKRVYHYLFEYDQLKLTTYSQAQKRLIRLLSFALLHRSFILITYRDGTSEVGQLTKRFRHNRFIFRSHDRCVLRLVHLDEVLRVDLG